MSRNPVDSKPLILVADDDPRFLDVMEHHLKTWGFRTAIAPDKGRLYRELDDCDPALLLLDVRFGEHDGVELLPRLLERRPGLPTIMLSAHGSIESAVTALRFGAVDYIAKPIDLERLRVTINHTLDARAHAGIEAKPSASGSPPPGPIELSRPILGSSEATVALIDRIVNVAATDVTVMILGESGSGKELVARAIHELSTRRSGPFVAINMAALPRELAESTLFGHEKGSFTGADRSQSGCCQAADGGTLFLDEIGEMELGLQAKLLRFLQERKIQRIGRTEAISVDVRIVTATNREPSELVKAGLFREDLYYRLNVVPIRVPPLRARARDIPILAEHFLEAALTRHRRPSKRFTVDALALLESLDWPGNVRQLENLVERLAILVPGPEIGAEDVRIHDQEHAGGQRPGAAAASSDRAPDQPPASGFTEFERIEKQAIVDSLEKTGGSVREAAGRLGISQATIYRKIKKYNIDL